MRPPKGFLLLVGKTLVLVCFLTKSSFAQATSVTPPVRDAQAVTCLQNATKAFGTTPSDSTATGNVTVIAGGLTQQGTIQILSRGSTESSVTVQAGSSNWSVIFSGGQANRSEAGTTTSLPLERAASSQALHFPLPFISSLLSNPDISIQFIGPEQINSSLANHIRVQDTFASQPLWQSLSEFTIADIWLDASTALPLKISRVRRDGGGSSPSIPISILYTNYQPVSGIQYPFTIQEFITDTLWATTTVQSVSFNTGLTDASFQLTQVGN
jgi:hypothetical protein